MTRSPMPLALALLLLAGGCDARAPLGNADAGTPACRPGSRFAVADWRVEPGLARAGQGDSRSGAALALGPGGAVHLLYGVGGLYYKRRGEPGETEVQTGAVGGHDIAVGPDGAPHISYARGDALQAYYARMRAGRFVSQPLGASGRTRVAVGKDGAVHVVGAGGPQTVAARVWVASQAPGGRFTVSEVASGDSGGAAIAVAADGAVALCYSDRRRGQQALRVARRGARPDAPWRGELVGAGAYAACAIAFDSSGALHVSAGSYNVATPGLYYFSDRSGRWQRQRVDGENPWTSTAIRVDESDVVHIAARDLSVRYGNNASGVFSFVTVHHGHGGAVAFDVDAGGSAHLAFAQFRYPDDELTFYASNRGAAQACP